MATTASKQAYFNPDNQVRRISHKKQCYNALIGEKVGLTYIEVAVKTGLTLQQCWKRLSDLHTEKAIYLADTKRLNGSVYSVYRISTQPQLFQTPKLTFKQFVKQKYPNILHEYEVLHEHKL